MTRSGPARDPLPVERDSRGIVSPSRFAEVAGLHKFPAPEPLTGLVRQFWVLRWALPSGVEHTQDVLSHPGANLSIGSTEADPDAVEARLYGVTRDLFRRVLRRRGWTIAATTWPGGLGAFLTFPAQDCTDRVLRPEDTLGLEGPALIDAVTAPHDDTARVAALADALTSVLHRAPAGRVEAAHEVAAVARIAETDRGLRRVEQLADAAGVGTRTLQRLFREYAGVSPTWMLRRYRLLDAAERVRGGEVVNWADVAGELGFSDQAHLVREFHAAIGETPEAYARQQRPGAGR
ncbi:helix-turn-helix domain-containing protein [Pseudonocardia endophytica]|uniref:AraC family transcriptional regulator n=1 Tax=Pseudonocardia endophytica TaxID=401976 RepID=A0A4R1HSS6_PSEEN|nr:helix-turn-helix domain-containing protein [Pseudonocardia endophytica]TCK24323.1 AraC family transcriptional regulator [Pseudonocardia endophytica]